MTQVVVKEWDSDTGGKGQSLGKRYHSEVIYHDKI